LDRNEVGSLLVAAGLGAANEHASVSLLAINGLRVSEAFGAHIDALGIERSHRTVTILRKGGKIVTIPPGRSRHAHRPTHLAENAIRPGSRLPRPTRHPHLAAYLAGAAR
jgi:site-specific recombinase XerC